MGIRKRAAAHWVGYQMEKWHAGRASEQDAGSKWGKRNSEEAPGHLGLHRDLDHRSNLKPTGKGYLDTRSSTEA